MKRSTILFPAIILSLVLTGMMSPEARANTITIKNDCTTFVIVSAYADKAQNSKIGEQVAWPGASTVITTDKCTQSIQTVSTVVGTIYNYLYPATCKNIRMTITKKPTSCYAVISEE